MSLLTMALTQTISLGGLWGSGPPRPSWELSISHPSSATGIFNVEEAGKYLNSVCVGGGGVWQGAEICITRGEIGEQQGKNWIVVESNWTSGNSWIAGESSWIAMKDIWIAGKYIWIALEKYLNSRENIWIAGGMADYRMGSKIGCAFRADTDTDHRKLFLLHLSYLDDKGHILGNRHWR